MKSCKICTNEDCTWSGHTDHISVGCLGFEPQTNADRIRSMTDEEMAEWVSAITLDEFGDKKDWLDWLQEEAVSNG